MKHYHKVLAAAFLFTFGLATAGSAQQLWLTFADSANEWNPLMQDEMTQTVYYVAGNTIGNVESRGEIGAPPLAPLDDQSTFAGEVAGDHRSILALGNAAMFEQVHTGDLIQFIAYWKSGGEVRLSYDSIVYDGSSTVWFGKTDSVGIPRPTVTRSRQSYLIQIPPVPVPAEILQGSAASVPGAMTGFNIYRALNGKNASLAEFVGFVPLYTTDESMTSYVDPFQAPLGTTVNYGIVAVFRGQGEAIGPQQEGVELRRADAWGRMLPLLTFN